MRGPNLALLLAATAAQAQSDGGGGGGLGHGGRGGSGSGGSTPKPATTTPPLPPATPVNQVEIVGVIEQISRETERLTIAYEPVDARNWPAGTMPFVVSKPALFDGLSVGQKVRFRLESEQISELHPY